MLIAIVFEGVYAMPVELGNQFCVALGRPHLCVSYDLQADNSA